MLTTMRIISFDLDYEIQQEITPNPNEKKPYTRLLYVIKKEDPMKRIYVAAIYEVKKDNQLVNRFYYLKTLKIFNIIQQVNFYHEIDRFIIVFQNFQEYQLDDNKLQRMSKEQKKQVLLQLSLTFTELVQRKAPFNLTAVNQLYYIDGFIFINMMDYNYQNPATDFSSLGCFKQFVSKFFDPEQIQEIDSFDAGAQTFGSYTESILYAYQLMDQHPLEAQYFKVFRYIFQIVQYKQLAALNANSHIYKFTKPSVLSKIIDFKITNEVIAKSSKIVGADNVEEVRNNVQTEIELMEKFEKNHRFAACYKYIRILDQSYLFMQYYCMNLRQYFELVEQKPQNYFSKLIVYNISYQFIRGLRFLHMAGIYHRDLKPENLFLTDEFIQKGEVHIADFDRSKQTVISRSPLRQIDDPTDNTPEYSPVEGMEAEDYTIDIWQFGLIIYEVANMGIYPGKRIVLEFDKVYGPEIIENKLKDHKYDIEFLQIIQKCLKENPKERPEARTLEEPLRILYENELRKQPKGPRLCYSQSFRNSNMFQINNKQLKEEVDEQS